MSTNNVEADATTINPNLAAALRHAARGWYIYPAFPGTKSKTNLKWREASTNSVKQHPLVDEVTQRDDLPRL